MLPNNRIYQFIKVFSTSTTKAKKTSINWRTQIKRTQLVHQISSTLLQRHNWPSLLQNLHLSSKLTPSLFLQILHKTKHNPQVSLNFFYWIKTSLHFEPDLISQCHIIRLLLGSGQTERIKPILDSLIQTHTATVLTHSMIQSCEVSACNALLDALYRQNEIRLASCLYGAMVRDGVSPNKFTWSLVAQILCRSGKFEVVLGLLDSGIYSSVMYNLVIDFYSKKGDFGAAFDRLNEMCNGRNLTPGFSTYSSILDGARRYEKTEVSDTIVGLMVEKKLLPKHFLSGNDSVIQKLSDMGKTYAAEMIFKRACDEKIELQDDTCGCMLKALSKEGRVKEAIQIYHLISERGITVRDSDYYAFVNVLCKEHQPEEVCGLLRDVVERGYIPCAMELSRFVASQCGKGKWKEVEELLSAVLDQGLLLDSFCCSSLMEYYCSNRQIDKAIALHIKIEKLKGSLDVATYDVLLDGLFKDGRMEEAVRIFDYMKELKVVSSSSFVIVVSRLCHLKELRKAMKNHDEMLKMGHKPDEATYKQVISGFM
ncbi:pentatricopeptide repeat-containing protein [Citrus sinensis]|uniref:pentatricopeptide repeat-containing protein At4g21170 isoform X2 n=1 Tax=Citrus sinensis TaxID=2711 RepID=UPI002198D14B|nr:pentatricopeptide repeat-containing protein At4g21170 isoform X2 [Citrus sinensis]KAH9748185.1 pentatricopeptide repeat-containing protein [Citrus sinensis]